ncbi:MAG: hypothetical protein DRN29_02505 [Thermoplasmata archaeon]|nr:MAG: hypothetical protein DRN29_02505 [Thermoplasmata archaeon]
MTEEKKIMVTFLTAVFIFINLVLPSVYSGESETEPLSSPGRIWPYWVKTWGSSGDEVATAVDADGGYIYVTGYTGEGIAFLLKYDEKGKLVWEKTWSGEGTAEASEVVVANGNIYVVGTTENGGNSDIFISKYDSEGNLLWYKTWGGSSDDMAGGIAAYGNNIYVCGLTKSFGALGGDAFLLKYDADGNFIWQKLWGKSGNEKGNDVVATTDGIYIAGYTTSYGVGGKDVALLKYDLDGNKLWAKTWGGDDDDIAAGVDYSQGSAYVTGYTASYSPHALILKYDPNGNMLFERRWGEEENDEAMSIRVYGDAVYTVGKTGDDAFLLKYSLDGTLAWAKAWGGRNEEVAYDIDVDNNLIYIVGYTTSYGEGGKDAFILKCNLQGRKSFSISNTENSFIKISDEKLLIWGREILPLSFQKENEQKENEAAPLIQ